MSVQKVQVTVLITRTNERASDKMANYSSLDYNDSKTFWFERMMSPIVEPINGLKPTMGPNYSSKHKKQIVTLKLQRSCGLPISFNILKIFGVKKTLKEKSNCAYTATLLKMSLTVASGCHFIYTFQNMWF